MTVLRDSEGGEDIEVSDDPDGYHTLEISKVPLFVTLSKVWKLFKRYLCSSNPGSINLHICCLGLT